MLEYKIVNDDTNDETDVTSNYSSDPTIPGPTIVLTEGDKVELTLTNNIGFGGVSVHTHGVHYLIASDGTLQVTNNFDDEMATTGSDYTYFWEAAQGTAGSWPYHDHTFGIPGGQNPNGLETSGLFGTVIVNPASGYFTGLVNGKISNIAISDIKKEFVAYVTDDAFWMNEINNSDGIHTPLKVNPILVAADDDIIRFHLIALGTDFHKFVLDNYKWLEPGTNDKITEKAIGPLENHVFAISAKTGESLYTDLVPSHFYLGMKGFFNVDSDGGPSIPGTMQLHDGGVIARN